MSPMAAARMNCRRLLLYRSGTTSPNQVDLTTLDCDRGALQLLPRECCGDDG